MEDTLGATINVTIVEVVDVLILVLMEDTLGAISHKKLWQRESMS